MKAIIIILLLPAVLFSQMTAKYSGIHVDESIQASFDSLLKKLPKYLQLHREQCGYYDQPSDDVIAELITDEQPSIRFFCLLTDSSLIRKGIFDKPGYLYKFNDLLNMVFLSRKRWTLNEYSDRIIFYFRNTQGEDLVMATFGNMVMVGLSSLKSMLLVVPYRWNYGTILINTDYVQTNFTAYNQQKLNNFFSHPFQTHKKTQHQNLLYSENNKQSKILTLLPFNYPIELISFYKDWFKVKCYHKNQELIGWIRKVDLGY